MIKQNITKTDLMQNEYSVHHILIIMASQFTEKFFRFCGFYLQIQHIQVCSCWYILSL